MSAFSIPFNRSCLCGNEMQYMAEAIQYGHTSGDNVFTKRCHQLLQQSLGIRKALLTTSCTHALEMSAILLDLQPGDEVIVPSFTFVSTANAFVLRGARIVFADIRPDTLNLDESRLEPLITPRTRAIILVHYAGVGCEMDEICAIAARHDIAVIEDIAHGVFARYKGRYLGTFGCMATQSFHDTKNFTCGEGGALLINDERFIERAEIIREKGTNRSRFFRGQVDKYSWVDIGSSYLPSDILAALLLAQLECREYVQSNRRRVWTYYQTHLHAWAKHMEIGLPIIPEHCEQSYHMFYMLFPTLAQRQAFIAHLKLHGIQSVFHYLPLHLSPMGQQYGQPEHDCPVAVDVSDRLVRLPFYNELSDSDLARVVTGVTDFVMV